MSRKTEMEIVKATIESLLKSHNLKLVSNNYSGLLLIDKESWNDYDALYVSGNNEWKGGAWED